MLLDAAQLVRAISFFPRYRCNMTPPLIPMQQPPCQQKWLVFYGLSKLIRIIVYNPVRRYIFFQRVRPIC